MDEQKIVIQDKETGSDITVVNPNFYGPAIPSQDNAYEENNCSLDMGNGKAVPVKFAYPNKPTEDYELAMWQTIDDFETKAWSQKNKGLTTGFPAIDKAFDGGLHPGFIIIGGDSNLGKCLSYDSEIVNSITGEVKTIEEIYNEKNYSLLSLQENFKLDTTKPSHFVDDGIKPVFEVTTSLGRKIKTTLTHPYLTINGWKKLKEISVGEYIATPRVVPVFGKENISEYECKIIGYFTAEGGIASGTKTSFTNGEQLIINDFKKSILKFNPNANFREEEGRNCVTIHVSDKTQFSNPVLDWIRDNNMNKKATEKTLPKKVFTTTKECLAIILRAMFDCDGSIYYSTTWCIEYATASYKMAKQLQHLLLRFGLCFSLREKYPICNGKRFTSYSLEIHDSEQVKSFIEQIGFYAKNKKAQTAYAELQTVSKKGANKDIIPNDIWNYVKKIKAETNIKWSSVGKIMGLADRNAKDIPHNFVKNKRNAQRKTIEAFGKGFNDQYLLNLSNSDIYWDKIVSIKYVGEEQVYDLTIPYTHNFIANDICVHNTAFLSQIAWQTSVNNPNAYVMDFSLDDSMADKLSRVAACSGKVIINAVKTPLNYTQYPLMLVRRKNALINIRNNVSNYRAYDATFSTFIEDIEKEIERMLIYFKSNNIDKQLVVCIDNFHDLNTISKPNMSDKEKYDFMAQWCADVSIKYDIIMLCTGELKKINGNRRAMLDDLRESVKIKYEAKAILLVYNEVHYKGENANIYFMRNNNPFKQPIFEVHFAKNKFNTFKGRVFFEFFPEMALMKECDPTTQKNFTNQLYS